MKIIEYKVRVELYVDGKLDAFNMVGDLYTENVARAQAKYFCKEMGYNSTAEVWAIGIHQERAKKYIPILFATNAVVYINEKDEEETWYVPFYRLIAKYENVNGEVKETAHETN